MSLNNIGLIHCAQGRYDEALKYYTESLEIRKEIGAKYGIAESLSGMKDTYLSLGLFDKGIKNGEEALSIYEEIGAKDELLRALASLIHSYAEIGDIKNAKEYIEKAHRIEEELPESEATVPLRLSISRFYEKEVNLAEAIKYAEETLEKAKANRDLYNQAEAYILLCELRKEDTEEYAESSLAIGKKINSLPIIWKSYYHLYKATQDKNYLVKAKEYLNKQLEHIPSEYINNFNELVKNYTKGELQ